MDSGIEVALLTMAATAFISVIRYLWISRSDRRAVRLALMAEIEAITEVAKSRHYVEDLLQTAEEIEHGSLQNDEVQQFSVSVSEGHARIYEAYITRLGCLPADEVQQVVRFYQLVDSVIQDVSEGGALHQGTRDPSGFREAAALLSRAFAITDSLNTKQSANWLVCLRHALCRTRCK